MPHLSPLNWMLAPLTFWTLMLLLSSLLWWTQTLSFTSFPLSNYSFKLLSW